MIAPSRRAASQHKVTVVQYIRERRRRERENFGRFAQVRRRSFRKTPRKFTRLAVAASAVSRYHCASAYVAEGLARIRTRLKILIFSKNLRSKVLPCATKSVEASKSPKSLSTCTKEKKLPPLLSIGLSVYDRPSRI